MRVYWSVAATMALHVAIVAAALFLGTWAGIAWAGVDVATGNLAAACLLLTAG